MGALISLLVDNWHLLRLYFCSEEYIYARCMFLILIVMELIKVGLEVALTYWQNAFMNTFTLFDQAGFLRLLVYFCFFLLAMTAVSVHKQYWLQLLQLHWRRWLTNDFLRKYLSGDAYYKISLLKNHDQIMNDQNDNPDQRISMDIDSYIVNTCTLVLGALNAGASLILNIIVLWSLSGVIKINITQYWSLHIYGAMVWAALTYAGIGTLIINWIGRALFDLKYAQEHYEANFRYGLVRLRDHAESVALYKSESNEHKSLLSLYFEVMLNFHKTIRRKLGFNWFVSLYNLTSHVFPYLVAFPRYFSKSITFGDLLQTSMAFSNVHKSLSFISDSYETIVSWRSATKRLIQFSKTLDELYASKQASNVKFIQVPEERSIRIQDLTVLLPIRTEEDHGQILINHLDLVLQSHQAVLITGKSGCGKSTFFRTLAGIWPYGHGTITFPSGDTFAFLPQKPYCPLDSLRHCLIYPAKLLSSEGDKNLKRLMCLCQMNHWCKRLDEIQDWSSVLSLGEQQKMAFIRMLHLRPKWIFLDEATSSLDEDSETYLYSILFLELANHSTIVSIGHRDNLRQFHQVELAFDNGHVKVIFLPTEKKQNFAFF